MPRLATLPSLVAALAGLSVGGCVQGLGDTTALVNVGRLGEFTTIEVGNEQSATPLQIVTRPKRPPVFEGRTTAPIPPTSADPPATDATSSGRISDTYRKLEPTRSDVVLVAVPRRGSTEPHQTAIVPEDEHVGATSRSGRIQTIAYQELAQPDPSARKEVAERLIGDAVDRDSAGELVFEVVAVVEEDGDDRHDHGHSQPPGVELASVPQLTIEPAVRSAASPGPAEPVSAGESESTEPRSADVRPPHPVDVAFGQDGRRPSEFADWTSTDWSQRLVPQFQESRPYASLADWLDTEIAAAVQPPDPVSNSNLSLGRATAETDYAAAPRELPTNSDLRRLVDDANAPAAEPDETTESPALTVTRPPIVPVLDPNVVAIPVVVPPVSAPTVPASGELVTPGPTPELEGVVELRAPEPLGEVDSLDARPRMLPLELPDPFALDAADTSAETSALAPVRTAAFDLEPVPSDETPLPLPSFDEQPPYVASSSDCGCQTGVVSPIFGEVCLGEADRCWCGECSPWKKLFKFNPCRENCDIGIGRQRLPFAPFEIEAAQPGNNLTLRYDAAYGMDRPDRSEFFWKKLAGTPGVPEPRVNYQQFWIVHEIGGGRFSTTTEIPFRFLDPAVNENTAGLSDIRIAPKIVLVDGRDWQFSHVFRTYIPSGAGSRGIGTGHASIEPGFLLRYKWTEDTWLHGQLKAWFPLGADPDFAGPTLLYGFGWGTNLCDTDTFAIIGTMEFTGVSYLDGFSTAPTGLFEPTDAETSLNVQPGARFVMGPAGDLGLFELGLSTGHAVTIRGQYENQIRLDLRWSY